MRSLSFQARALARRVLDRIWTEHVWPKLVSSDLPTCCSLNAEASRCGNSSSKTPIANGVRPHTKHSSKGNDTSGEVDCMGCDIHAPIVTISVTIVNRKTLLVSV